MDIDLTGGGRPPGAPPGPRPTQPRRSPLLRVLISLGGSVGMLPIFFVVFSGTPSCMGFEEPTLRSIEACPAAVAALGTPVHRSWVGASCGNAETEDAFGRASWTFPVAGPSGSGSVHVIATRSGGPWIVSSAVLDTGAGSFETVSCAGSAGVAALGGAMPGGPSGATMPTMPSMPSMPSMPGLGGGAPLHLAATVDTSSPGAPATLGEACTIDLTPAGMGAPCRVDVACGGRAIYGGTHALCLPGGRGGTTAMDASSSDGDPILTVTSESGQATMTSVAGVSTWTLTMSFPPTP